MPRSQIVSTQGSNASYSKREINPEKHSMTRRSQTLSTESPQTNSTVGDESINQNSRKRHLRPIHSKVFVPTISYRPPIVAVTPKLATATRAVLRAKYDNEANRRRNILEQKLEEIRQRQAEEEAEEIKRLRKETVHKPEPIKRYK
uniref:TPX2 C-terminal domain-containing protein n=1 Tax=Trichobilharzia regenti TaxID=157069 RepID=A0AA85JPZ1_TRIRE|nr:unnamed protein product [Trichobilharzia regenti]